MKQRIVLDDNKSLGFGIIVPHCGKFQQINYHEMQPGEWWECVDCKKPLVLCTEGGWFEIGNKLEF